MKRMLLLSVVMLGLAGMVGVTSGTVIARESAPRGAEAQTSRLVPIADPATDPAIRALVLQLAASVLREAAASPDPIQALANALERKLMFALRNPELARLAESAIGEAVKDAPSELREPLALFAIALLGNFRHEMLGDAKPGMAR